MLEKWQTAPAITLWKFDIETEQLHYWVFSSVHFVAWFIIYGGVLMLDILELLGVKDVSLFSFLMWNKFNKICLIFRFIVIFVILAPQFCIKVKILLHYMITSDILLSLLYQSFYGLQMLWRKLINFRQKSFFYTCKFWINVIFLKNILLNFSIDRFLLAVIWTTYMKIAWGPDQFDVAYQRSQLHRKANEILN